MDEEEAKKLAKLLLNYIEKQHKEMMIFLDGLKKQVNEIIELATSSLITRIELFTDVCNPKEFDEIVESMKQHYKKNFAKIFPN